VFVVGYLGDWRRAAAVLFERESLSGNPPPSREARKEATTPAGERIAAFDKQRLGQYGNGEVSSTLAARDYKDATDLVAEELSVRRLTPTEAERLQGFPDCFTQIPYRNKPADKCPDGPRYKALGNSFAVPVVRWIGERIQAVEGLANAED